MHSSHGAASLIPPSKYSVVLPHALPYFKRTLERYAYSRYSLEEIVFGLRSGLYQLWGGAIDGHKLYVVTELVQEKVGPVVHVILGGGSLDEEDEMLRYIVLIEQWAENMGAVGVAVWGRVGWKRKIAKYGYQHETSLFRRVFNERMM
jgi:hypothetical protein